MPEPFDYKVEFDRLMLLVMAAAEWAVDLDSIERTLREADTLGPILDPTRYRDALFSGRLDDQRAVVDVAAPFIRKAREIIAAAKAQDSGTGPGGNSDG